MGESIKWLHHIVLVGMDYLMLGRSRRGVGVGDGVDIFRSESESWSLKICRLLSPASENGEGDNFILYTGHGGTLSTTLPSWRAAVGAGKSVKEIASLHLASAHTCT